MCPCGGRQRWPARAWRFGGDGIDAIGTGLGFSWSFTGKVNITGSLNVSGTKFFRIDHPLNPANKYLCHAALEFSEVLNLHAGNATLDFNGEATVQLPDWFEALNCDFRYQLTAIGAPATNLHVAQCRITVGDHRNGNIPVRTYREILHQYLYHPECKFAGPDGRPCDAWTRGTLQRRHIIAAELKCCGKELKRKLEQGPVDHEADFKVKVYGNGRVTADDETIRALSDFSERDIHQGTGLSRRIIRPHTASWPGQNQHNAKDR